MQAVWIEPEFSDRQRLFHDLVGEAETGERLLMLFGLLKQTLRDTAQQGESPARLRAGARRALAAIGFLRESLGAKVEDPFHCAFKRFYNHLHRQIIDAVRDGNPAAFFAIARSIETLISDDHADAFVGHCLEQSEWREHRLVFILERLFAGAPKPVLIPRDHKADHAAFNPLRFA